MATGPLGQGGEANPADLRATTKRLGWAPRATLAPRAARVASRPGTARRPSARPIDAEGARRRPRNARPQPRADRTARAVSRTRLARARARRTIATGCLQRYPYPTGTSEGNGRLASGRVAQPHCLKIHLPTPRRTISERAPLDGAPAPHRRLWPSGNHPTEAAGAGAACGGERGGAALWGPTVD